MWIGHFLEGRLDVFLSVKFCMNYDIAWFYKWLEIAYVGVPDEELMYNHVK